MKKRITVYELLRFHVISSKGDDIYLVDLAYYSGKGACTCPDFRIRVAPTLRDSLEAHRPCRHIIACRELLADMLIKEFVRRYPCES